MNNKTKQGGLGIVSVLTIIFIVLKLLGVIKWSWIWGSCQVLLGEIKRRDRVAGV